MNVCEDDHVPVAYDGDPCPVCQVREDREEADFLRKRWIEKHGALAARLAEAERLIDGHNAGCVEACGAGKSRRCDAYTSRAMQCPDCPRDWLIERTADSAAPLETAP